MQDRILSTYVKDFVGTYSLGDLDEPTAFEHLASFCVVSKYNPENFEPGDVVVGGSGDLGLDGVGILVNDHLVRTKTDVDYFKEALHRLDVQFIFVQAKTSSKFEGSEIGTFISGVRQFFQTEPPPANEYILSLHDLKEYIFDSSIDMDRSPICRLFYVTTGSWQDDATLSARIGQGIRDLEATNLFSSVEFVPLDSDGVKQYYREINQKVTRGIKFERHTILPSISGVKEAYIGILPCLEYLNLICDDNGNLNRRLFYDNVRDFQGHNAVNQEIEETVNDIERNDRFALLNNGITIVARDKNNVGATFRLSDFQIVNGCQTSHVLYLNRERLTENVFLPIKLIVTGDPEVINQIIQGTNRQTEVKVEAFESLAPFQKELEEFYLAVGRNLQDPIYYERRSKQYEHLNIRRDRIITLATQVQCFVAMFLNEPQSTHRYYGELLKSYRNRLFSNSHFHMPYFLAGATLNKVEQMFAAGSLPRDLKKFKYQLLMVFRLMNQPYDVPQLNQRKINAYCQSLLDVLDDPSRCEAAFLDAAKVIRTCISRTSFSRDPLERTRAFTDSLVTATGEKIERTVTPATTTRLHGFVKRFSQIMRYGFIAGDDGNDYFFHVSEIADQREQALSARQRVEFTPIETKRGLQALNIEIV